MKTGAWMQVSGAAILLATAGLGHIGAALAQSAAPAATPADTPAPSDDPALKLNLSPLPTWTVQVEPVVWYAGPAGDLTLPGGAGEVQLSTLNLDTSRVSPAAEIHINADRWRFSFSGADYSADIETTSNSAFQIGSLSVADNDTMRNQYDWTTVQLTAGYLFWTHDFAAASEKPEDAVPAVLRLYAFGGGRLHDIDISLQSLAPARAGTTGTDQFYAELIVGARAELELAEDFTLDLELSGGGMADSDRSIASFDIIAGFQWRPCENVGLQIGWRQLAYWLSDADADQEFSLNGETAGVYAGVVIRF